MKVGQSSLRTLVVSGLAFGITATGVALPAQASLFAAPQASAASCSSFKRVKIVSKREILNQVVTAELRNGTRTDDTLVVEKSVSDTRSTATAFTADWTLFDGALKLGVSRTVTNEHTISGVQQTRAAVGAGRKVRVRGMVRTWYVKSEVTQRSSSCAYKTYQVQGEVATTDDIVWATKDIGRA